MVCADCGGKMIRSKSGTFLCRINLNGQGCVRKGIEEAELKEAIFQSFWIQFALAGGMERLLVLFQTQLNLQEQNKQKEKKLEDQIQQKSIVKYRTLFEAYANGVITEAEYLSAKIQYKKEIEEQLSELEQRKQAISGSFSLQNQWITAIWKKQRELVITQKAAAELIQRIRVIDSDRIEIVWNFQDKWVHCFDLDACRKE